MSRLEKDEIRLSLLDYLAKRGVVPGCLLIAKTGASLNMFEGSLELLEEKIDTLNRSEVTFVMEGSVLLFVNAHGIRLKTTNNAWDFWFEFLLGETTIFIHSASFGDWKLKNEFEIKHL